MMNEVLATIDITSIQSYVFSSNRIKEAIGASELVRYASETLPRELAEKAVWMAGGGNATLIFPSIEEAKAFARVYSEQVLVNCPGLRVAIAFSDAADGLAEALEHAHRTALPEAKAILRSGSFPGCPLTRECGSTGQPSIDFIRADDEQPGRRWVSAEVLTKRTAAERAHKELDAPQSEFLIGLCRELQIGPKSFPLVLSNQIGDLGGTHGEDNRIAVIHADGDGVGKRVQLIAETAGSEVRERLVSFSAALQSIGEQAFLRTVRAIVESIEIDKDGNPSIVHPLSSKGVDGLPRIKLDRVENGWVLPVRPIVIGGDDMTVLTDARIGLAFASLYVRSFAELSSENKEALGGNLAASVGVAFVHSKYPVKRAYDLAEALTSNAKTFAKQRPGDFGAVDWLHVASTVPPDLAEVRQQSYQVDGKTLGLRPISANPEEYRSWETVREVLASAQKIPQSRRKALLSAISEGPDAVNRLRLTRLGDAKLPKVSRASDPQCQDSGFSEGFSPYFDALEMADEYIPLGDDRNRGAE
jgi:hypothetical protein